MCTKMTDEDWATALTVFRAALPRRGAKGRDDRLFLEALHYFSVHNVSWRALPERFGKWNSVWTSGTHGGSDRIPSNLRRVGRTVVRSVCNAIRQETFDFSDT